MNAINLPIATKVWPVVSTTNNPGVRFSRKATFLTQAIVIDPTTLYKIPNSNKFKYFQDGQVTVVSQNGGTISPNGFLPHPHTRVIDNAPGTYAYYQFDKPTLDANQTELAYGFIFNMHKASQLKIDTEWQLEPYFKPAALTPVNNPLFTNEEIIDAYKDIVVEF
jgi:hypothetical protein